MLLLATLALAHVPHQVVVAFAPAPGLDASRPWWLVAQPYLPMLMRSDDAGASWTSVGGPPMGDGPRGLAQLADGTVVVLGQARYWWSTDGLAWASAEAPGGTSLVAASGDLVLLGGTSGIWAGTPGSDLAREWPEAVTLLSGGDVASAATPLGAVLARVDDTWEALFGPGPTVTSVVASGAHLFAGTSLGSVARWSAGAWTACGALPGLDPSHDDVVALALDGDVLAAGTGAGAALLTSTDCAEWTDASAPVRTEYDVAGGAQSEFQSVVGLAVAGNLAAWAGWSGAWTRVEGAWRRAITLGADLNRGLDVAPGGAFPRVLAGGYGAGVMRTDDGGLTWTAENHGLGAPNVQDVVADTVDAERVYVVAGHRLSISTDGAISAAPGGLDFNPVTVSPVPGTPLHAWTGAAGRAVHTADGGGTWTDATGLAELLPAGAFSGATVTDTHTCLGFERPAELYCAPGPEGPWARVHQDQASPPVSVVGWPREQPRFVVLASGDSAWRSHDGFVTSRRVLRRPLDRLLALAVADDDTLLVVTATGRVLTSVDAGESWTDVGAQVDAPAGDLAPLPGFAETGELLVGTLDGVFHVASAWSPPATTRRFAPVQRLDDSSDFWTTVGCTPSTTDSRGALDTLRHLGAGCTLSARVRGNRLRLLGLGTGAARLTVDGGAVEVIAGDAGDAVTTWWTAELADGWHDVELAGVEPGLWLDALEATGDGATLAAGPVALDSGDSDVVAAPHPAPPCGGCATPHPLAASWGLALAAAAARRYRRATRGTP